MALKMAMAISTTKTGCFTVFSPLSRKGTPAKGNGNIFRSK
jgi:hypothetical protein